jgi:hypothetical protein
MRALPALLSALVALTSFAGRAQADDGEWHAGISVGYASLLRSEQPSLDGVGTALQLRYGVHEALDAFVELQGSWHPEGALSYGATTGALYVLDVGRFVPMFGLGVGVVDVVTESCPPTVLENGSEGPPLAPCGHSLRPSLGVPFSFDYRLVPELLVGLHGRYAFLLGSPATSQLYLGAHAGLAF